MGGCPQARGQSSPPTVPVAKLPQYANGIFPPGEIQEHPLAFNAYRVTSEEKRLLDRSNEAMYNEVREAAEVHRQVRQDFQKWVRPGLTMIEIAQ
jgi:methionyl aminopeptidase